MLTLANITQRPSPLEAIQKVTFSLSQLLTEAYSTAESERGKAHAGCLSPREDCIFYLSPLGFIFTVNSWLKCNQPRNPPYVHSCHSSSLANRIKCKQMGKEKKKNLSAANQSKKALLLVLPVLRNHRCASDLWKGRESQKMKLIRKLIRFRERGKKKKKQVIVLEPNSL